jgi:Transposase DDE domain
VTTDIDTLATALYVKTDDLLKQRPDLAPWRPKIGLQPRLTDAELVTLAVMQALLGYASESRWLRYARAHLGHLFGYLPGQPGYNRRLRAAAGLITTLIRLLAADTSLWTDDVWVVDSTPVECGRSRDTARRSDLAGWAEYGYCASHSRYFWGLRLHLVATLGGLPIAFALTGAKADERQTLLGILAADPALAARRPGQILIADKHYYGAEFETTPRQATAAAAAPGPQERGRTRRSAPVQAAAPDHRVHQPDLQSPTRPRTTRRSHPRRSTGPRPAAHPGPDRGDLAQRPHRRASTPFPHRLRPLTCA